MSLNLPPVNTKYQAGYSGNISHMDSNTGMLVYYIILYNFKGFELYGCIGVYEYV
jgi:hypothetical protein